jgi:hypothetical protein
MAMKMKKFRLSGFLFLCLLFSIPHIYTLETLFSIQLSPEWVTVSAKALALDTPRIFSSLEEGLASEIVFQFRVYKIKSGFFSFFGDQLVIEKELSYIAYKDFFLNQYIIRTDDKKYFYFETINDFINSYSAISGFQLVKTDMIHPSDYYILARVRSTPVKLDPPLHIIALFTSIGKTSPWAEYRFSHRERGSGENP